MRSVFSGLLLFLTLTGFEALAQEAESDGALDESQVVAPDLHLDRRLEREVSRTTETILDDLARRLRPREAGGREADVGQTVIRGGQRGLA